MRLINVGRDARTPDQGQGARHRTERSVAANARREYMVDRVRLPAPRHPSQWGARVTLATTRRREAARTGETSARRSGANADGTTCFWSTRSRVQVPPARFESSPGRSSAVERVNVSSIWSPRIPGRWSTNAKGTAQKESNKEIHTQSAQGSVANAAGTTGKNLQRLATTRRRGPPGTPLQVPSRTESEPPTPPEPTPEPSASETSCSTTLIEESRADGECRRDYMTLKVAGETPPGQRPVAQGEHQNDVLPIPRRRRPRLPQSGRNNAHPSREEQPCPP